MSPRSLAAALGRGLFAALISGFVWGMFAAMTRIRLDWIPVISVGFAVGLMVRGDTVGVDRRLGVIGGVLTMAACLIAEAWSLWAIVISQLSMLPHFPFAPSALTALFADHFRLTNLAAYSVAVWEGYHFAAHRTWAQRIFDPATPVERRRWLGWAVFVAAVAAFGLLFLNVHRSKIADLAVAPDGDHLALATSGYDTSVTRSLDIWNLPQRRANGLPQNRVGRLAWSHDGRMLAVEDNLNKNDQPKPGRIALWDVPAQRMRLLEGHEDFVLCLAFSPTADVLATGAQDGSIRLWDAKIGVTMAKLQEPYAVQSVSFSGDGKTLAVGLRDGTVALWDAAAGRRLAAFTHHMAAVSDLAFAQLQGREVLFSAGSIDGTLRAWETMPFAETAAYRQPLGWIAGLALSPAGDSLAVFGGSFHREGEVRLLDPANGQLQRAFTVHANTVCAATFAEQGKLLIAGTAAPISPFTWRRDGEVYLWDVATGDARPPLE